ncbi:MAG: hypothetical protein ABIO24_00875 [Saprospiraceae bacterium]
MRKNSMLRWTLLLIFTQTTILFLQAQVQPDPQLPLLLGRWEVVAYAEQGVQVDKKQPALPQAIKAYRHNRVNRSTQFYGYSEYEDYSRHESRDYDRWAERDSIVEVERVTRMIAQPTYVVFFPDSTLSVYNKDVVDNHVNYSFSWRFAFLPATRSLYIFPYAHTDDPLRGQILLLTATRITLFLPGTAEIVELVKTPFSLP